MGLKSSLKCIYEQSSEKKSKVIVVHVNITSTEFCRVCAPYALFMVDFEDMTNLGIQNIKKASRCYVDSCLISGDTKNGRPLILVYFG